MLGALTADDFRPHIGDSYRLASSTTEAADAVLTAVTEHPMRPGNARAPFDIIFRTPLGTTLEQGLFRVEHPDAVIEGLFLVPVGPDPEAEGMLYQAVFG